MAPPQDANSREVPVDSPRDQDNAWAEVRPATQVVPTCESCGADLSTSVDWCDHCYACIAQPHRLKLASPGRRFCAYLLDSIGPGFGWHLHNGAAMSRGGMVLSGVVAVGYGILWLVLLARSTTPGKSLLHMRVVDARGRPIGFGNMIVRSIVKFVSTAATLGIGYLMILTTKNRQALHDKIVGSFVAWED